MNSLNGSRADIDQAFLKHRFDELLNFLALNGRDSLGIGTYSEKSLHFILKNLFEPDRDCHEVAFKGYVADVMRNGKIIEIQTATLSGLRGKLDAFLPDACVRLVFPVRRYKSIVWMDPETGEVRNTPQRRKAENMYSLLCELIYIVDYLRDPNLCITAVELSVDDYRYLDGWSRDKKKGATKLDTVPTELISVTDLTVPDSLYSFIPAELGDTFTRQSFSKATGLRGRALWAALKVLEAQRIIEKTEPDGKRHRYVLINKTE
ncbi:MAG: hypothetical protein IJO81_05185 [Clostridia bacterium]|nr:hypothetical protein [Clostridia bacterium]